MGRWVELLTVAVLGLCAACDEHLALAPNPTVPALGEECLLDSQCMPPFVCSPEPALPGGPSCVAAGKSPGSTAGCRVPRYGQPPDGSLIHGFSASELTLFRNRSGAATVFTWSAPEHTEWVQCALFACTPEFLAVDDNTQTIANYSSCVLADESEPPMGSFNLGDLHRRVVWVHYLPQRLAVGCWAYGMTGILAASRLETVGLDELPAIPELWSGDGCASGGQNGLACEVSDRAGWLGSCDKTICRRRCNNATDCELMSPLTPDSGLDAAAPESNDAGLDGEDGDAPDVQKDAAPRPCSHECVPISWRPDIGMCVPVDVSMSAQGEQR